MIMPTRHVTLRVLFAICSLTTCLLGQASSRAAQLIPLRAGPVTASFDAENVFLRYIRVGDHEILRGINAPIRNENWATIAPQVSNLIVKQRNDSFVVTFDVACQQADIDFRWQGRISGNAEGEIEFTFDGQAFSTFKKNRIGFCVLHGPAAAGKPWELETVNGEKSAGHFPQFISPHQPAKNLKAITHELTRGLRARVAFEGDTFEMEDQRNWTDASFKTYCTPLEIPYPVTLTQGAQITQKVRIQLLGKPSQGPAEAAGRTVLTLGDKQAALPLLGLQISAESKALTERQQTRLKALHLDHLRVDLNLSNPGFVKQLERATKQAKALGLSLHVSLGLGETPDFAKLATAIATHQPPVAFWLVRGGDPEDLQRVRDELPSLQQKSKLGVTRVTNFVDLNRARPEDKTIDAVGFAINPQIHAFDHASMIETLPIHAYVVNSARQFAGQLPLIIGPITLAPQLLDGVDQPGGPPQGGPLPTHIDPRQVEPFAAAWTLGSLKYLADAGAHSATFYETVGWAGIMDADEVTSRPKTFPSRPGQPFPVYHLLREIGELPGASVRQISSSNQLSAVGLAVQAPGRLRVFVGNLTAAPQTVTLRGLSGKPVPIQVLGKTSTALTPELSIRLPAYGIARLERVID